jgi:hypothetical protein
VSTATVSRVLSGRTVAADLHERVQAAVLAVGYRPNLAARRLRSRHTNTIGLIVADIRNPFFTAVSRMVEDIAYERGQRVILCNTDEDPAKEAMYLQLMHEERVTGVILAPTRAGLAQVARSKPDFPMVLIDRTAPGMAHDSVVLDNQAMAVRWSSISTSAVIPASQACSARTAPPAPNAAPGLNRRQAGWASRLRPSPSPMVRARRHSAWPPCWPGPTVRRR